MVILLLLLSSSRIAYGMLVTIILSYNAVRYYNKIMYRVPLEQRERGKLPVFEVPNGRKSPIDQVMCLQGLRK